jgi:hypothetical protein
MKITARLLASSTEQSTEQPMVGKAGRRKQPRQQVSLEFILLMPILGQLLATTVRS